MERSALAGRSLRPGAEYLDGMKPGRLKKAGARFFTLALLVPMHFSRSRAFQLPAMLPRRLPRAGDGLCRAASRWRIKGAIGMIGDAREASTKSTEEYAKARNVPVDTTDWQISENGKPYSEVIDVRTPLEYSEDHIPGAINLPILSNEQRVIVGTKYAESPFEGRKLGARLIMENMAVLVGEHFAEKSKDYKPLIYCWRGGQRSGSMAHVLSEIGFRSSKLTGGYKSYRSEVQAFLKQDHNIKWCMLSGPTGSCKTRLLKRFEAAGHQVVDLEGLANHRGSVLGGMGEQPSQKAFEGALAWTLRDLDPSRPVWVESESANIGAVQLPGKVIDSLRRAPRYEVTLPFERRVSATLDEYEELTRQPEHLKSLLAKLKRFLGAKTICEWDLLIDEGRWEELVSDLLVQHYDPTYARSQAAHREKHAPMVEKLEIADWDKATLNQAVAAMEGRLEHSEGYRAAYGAECAATGIPQA